MQPVKYSQSTVISCECTHSKNDEEAEFQLVKDGIPIGASARVWTRDEGYKVNFRHEIIAAKFDSQGLYGCQVKTMGYTVRSTKKLLLIEGIEAIKTYQK